MSDFINSQYGQENNLSVLNNFIKNKIVPHAFLFSGPEGVGKFYIAGLFAQNLSKFYGASLEIQNKIKKLEEPYIKLIFPLPRGKNETNDDSPLDKLSKESLQEVFKNISIKSVNPFYKLSISDANIIKINSIRDIRKNISIDFQDIKYRFIFILDAHLMNEEAQNALLKSLEEPPAGVIFILITPFKDRLLPTILSRCWNINFEALTEYNIKRILTDFYEYNNNDIEQIAVFAEGSVSQAIELIDLGNNELLEDVINLLRNALVKKYNQAFVILSQYLNDRDNFELFLEVTKKWFTDVQRYIHTGEIKYFTNYKETIEKFEARFKNYNIPQIFKAFDDARILASRNVSLNIIAANIIFEISTLGMR